MNDRALDRLLRAAARAPRSKPEGSALALENRVLARWRAGETENELAFLVTLFRRAVICASIVMVLSLGWSLRMHLNENPSQNTLANYALTVQLRP